MSFTQTKLSIAILLATTSVAYASTTDSAKLDIIDVVAENSGAKNKTNVVTLSEIDKSTETDLRGLLKEEPSINFGGGNGTSQWLTIRGMGQDQVDLRVDNTSSDTQLFHHQGRFMVDPSLIKIVSVQKGAGSASAGIGATSGSIVAKTLDAKELLQKDQHFGFKLNGGYSSNKGHSKGITLFGKAQNIDVLVSTNFTQEENFKPGKGYRATDGGTKVKNSALGQRGLLAKLGIDINENHRIVASHRQERHYGERALREEFDFSQSYETVRPTNGVARLTPAQRQQGYSLQQIGNDYYLIDKNGDFIPNTATNAPAYRITTTDTSNLEWTGKNLGFIDNIDANLYRTIVIREETADNSRAKVITNGANLNLDSYIGENHAIKYGLNWREQQGRPPALSQYASRYQKKEDIGVYAEGIWGINALTLTTGIRYDHFQFNAMDGKKVSKGNINPSVGLIWEVVDGLTFNGNLNYATRSPRLFEPFIASGEGRRGKNVVSISDKIKAEKARDVEIGFNYNLNDILSVNGSYFWKTIHDVHALTEAQDGIRTLYNGGKLKNKGYEVGTTLRYNNVTVKASVADSKPELIGNALDVNTLAVLIGRTWTASVSYQFEQPNLEIGWKGRFVENEKGMPSRGSNGNDNQINRPGYGVNDLFATWKARKDLNINFAVNNVFNKYYKSHSQRTGANSLPAVGRDFRVNVNYTF